MSILTSLLGKNIVRYREALGLTQAELAELAGTSAPTISRYESGEAGISSDAIERIAKALNLSEMDLVYSGQAPKALRILETVDQVAERVKSGLILLEIITPETTENLLKASKETKQLVTEALKNYLVLSEDEKLQIALAISTLAKKYTHTSLIQFK